MKVYISPSYVKLSSSFDDQRGYINRDMGSGPLPLPNNRATEGDDIIIERWNKRKIKKENRPMTNIYQLGIKLPMTQKEIDLKSQ